MSDNTPQWPSLERVQMAIDAIRRGEVVILVDDEGRENEGDLVMAAEKVTPEAINFMARFGRGLICLSLTEERLEELQIPMMVQHNTTPFGTAFTVSIEAATGITTGISAADRARTVQVAVDPASTPSDLVRPGHIFPLRARRGGVLVRTGQTEGSVDLARLAGLKPAGVICEIMNDDGTMARMDDLRRFAQEHHLLLVSIADLIQYRLARESLVERLSTHPCPTPLASDFQLSVFRSLVDGAEHLALWRGPMDPDAETLVRVQYHNPVADIFGGMLGDKKPHLQGTLRALAQAERGVLLYMYPASLTPSAAVQAALRKAVSPPQEVRLEAIRAEQVNTVNPEFRDFGTGAQILSSLGVGRIRLLTNNPRRIVGVEAYGLQIEAFAPIPD
jgi:3,4-dihydroxy 2-butanone 4-phosphate synthase/GTP cyclohydrolase II